MIFTALEEVQTIVWRDDGPPVQLPLPARPSPIGDARFTPGPVQLFLFSAATANAHRIHYDLAYASGEEGYPGLVVHGPLVAAQLLGLWERRHGPAKRFSFRAQAPLFAGQPIALTASDDGLQALRCDGTVAIPLGGKVGSLNVSVAAAVLLFEARRQRGAREHL